MKYGPYVVFSVNPTSGDVTTQGALSVKGKAFFEDAVTVDAPLTVTGDTLMRAGLQARPALLPGSWANVQAPSRLLA